MGKTAWRAAPWYDREQWLATDGTVLQAPTVETTPSHRRWRISGTDMSVQKHELPDQIRIQIQRDALRRGTQPWFRLLESDEELKAHRNAANLGADFAFTQPPTVQFSRAHAMPIGFEFAHPTMPIMAVLWVVFRSDHYSKVTVSTKITYRPTDRVDKVGDGTGVAVYDDNNTWSIASFKSLKPVPMPLSAVSFGTNPRKAAAHFLEQMRAASDLDELLLPDGRDNGTLTLRATRTNYTKDFYRAILDMVQGEAAMKRLAEHLDGIKRELSNLGLVASNKERFDLPSLLNGNLREFQVQIQPQDEPDSEGDPTLDPMHTVLLDLAQGVFFVDCSNRDLEAVAEAWNVAKFKEELTGNTDVLLAFARAHSDAADHGRVARIVKSRKVTVPK